MSSSDCLILGFYECPFPEYVGMLQAMGIDSGAYRDVALAYVEHEGQPMRALDILTHFYYEGCPYPERPFHNADFLLPAVAYLTTYLRRRGYAADYVNLPHLEKDKLHYKLQAGPKSVVITTTLYVSPHPIMALAETVREHTGGAKIIVGGPYIVNQVQTMGRGDLCTLFDYLGGDIYVLCQEGEATLAAVLEALRSGTALGNVPNLAFKNADGAFSFTAPAPEANDLAENIIDYSPFQEETPGEILSIRTSKSCPFACAFCGFPERAGKYTFLGLADVEAQLDAIAGLGRVTTLSFLDDTFNVPKRRFKDLLRLMIRKKYGFRWNCFYRADQGDQESIELMAEAGCEGVFLGIESGSDRILALMNKSARREHYLQAIPAFRRAGISTYASFIVGFPGETDDTVRESISLIEECAPEYFRGQLWYADPLTPIWQERERHGITGAGFNWSHNTMSSLQACDWIERMFLEIRNSEWLPQFGFEQWSTFYLARKGMTRPQVASFVRSFNALIGHRIVSNGADPPTELIERLRDCCQFERTAGERRMSASAIAGPSGD
jgi:anaerobic magnesium-protoporphyrin IX monomethyl ester cyclase